MRLNPETRLASLLSAIPSSALALKKFGIAADGNEEKTLQQVCADGGVDLEVFLQAMDEIDWDEDFSRSSDE